MWAMRSFINPGHHVSHRSQCYRVGDEFSFIPRSKHTLSRCQCSPAQFPILAKALFKRFCYFFFFFLCHSSPHRAGDEERAQLVSRRVCDPSPYDTPRVWGWWNPMDPIVPFGFIYARTCHIRQRRTLCQSYSLSCFEKNSSKYTPVPFVTNGG